MTISNLDDVIDSRDVIERIEELESIQAELVQQLIFDKEQGKELDVLRALANEASQYSNDWEYGETLIRYSYWENYVREMLEDCGEIPKNLPWYICIDWETTADNISQDYDLVDFDGVDYYIRSI